MSLGKEDGLGNKCLSDKIALTLQAVIGFGKMKLRRSSSDKKR